MSLATASVIAASIVPFDLTAGIATVASVMLGLFVLVMVYLSVAPIVSSEWAGRGGATTARSTAEPSDD